MTMVGRAKCAALAGDALLGESREDARRARPTNRPRTARRVRFGAMKTKAALSFAAMFEPSQDDAVARAARARLGTVLRGKWTLERLLGTGGMATVYLGVHRNGSKVAIKVLHPWLATHDDAVRRFLHEGYLGNKVEHPGVVHVIDDDLAPDGAPFLVMELLDGRSLDTILESEGPFEVKRAVETICQVLDVLASAHEKGIIHRDLKPANVFLLRDGSIKVLDFGIARLAETSNPNSTVGGSILGTPAFMPPEQARGRWDDVDARSDLWAIGATLYMLLTNRGLRDESGTINEALLAAISAPVPPVADMAPELPSAVAAVLDRALAFDKNGRWSSAREMRDALAAASGTWIDAPPRDAIPTGAAIPHMHTLSGLAPWGQSSSRPPPQSASLPPSPSSRSSGTLVQDSMRLDRSAPPTPAVTFVESSTSVSGQSTTAPASTARTKLVIAAIALVGIVGAFFVVESGRFRATKTDHVTSPAGMTQSPMQAAAPPSAWPMESGAEAPSTTPTTDAPSTTPTAADAPPTSKAASSTQRPMPVRSAATRPTKPSDPLDQGRF